MSSGAEHDSSKHDNNRIWAVEAAAPAPVADEGKDEAEESAILIVQSS